MSPTTIAGRYRMLREVGRGGMGSVWLCRDERLGRDVAAKQVGHLPGESVPTLARAMREARSLAALNHPNVVAVYDAVEDGDYIWLVMEYVPGRTLSQMVAEDGPLAPERAAWIGAQVADGLAAAHARDTIHRDVKPGNVLVAENDLAKISDFGIARTLGEEKLTVTGMITGTPAYLSPELARGEDPNRASDVWALGATLYAAVEGHSPYPDQSNPIAMLMTIANERPPQPLSAGILAEPIGRMMDPDAGSRWDMADAAHALHRIHDRSRNDGLREGTAAFAVASSAPESQPEPDPEPAAPAVPPAAVPPAAGAGTSGPDEGDRGGRGRPVLLVAAALVLVLLAVGVALLTLGGGDDDPGPVAADQSTDDDPSATSSEDTTESSPSEPTQEPTEEPDESATEPEEPAGEGATGFVEGYYGALPGDTDTAWSLLSPSYQDEVGGIGTYAGFWATIDSVAVEGSTPVGDDAVDVTLVYTTDGVSQREVRRIFLEQSDGSYLITGDEIVG